jgi:hypothetical protein
MDWTWSLDRYVAGGLLLGPVAVVLVAFLWWVWGAVRLLRRSAARVALLLPYGLAWGIGLAREPGVGLLLFTSWLSAEVVVPRARRARGETGAALDPVAACAALAGALCCLGVLWRGPLGKLAASLVTAGELLALLGVIVAAGVYAIALWLRWCVSPLSRAATAVVLVLAFDGLYLTPGGLTVLFLGLPMLVQAVLGGSAAVQRRWSAGGSRLAAAGVWMLALVGLVGFSRFNLRLSASRSADVIAACRRYEADHGRMPETLGELVPAYVARVPRADWTALGDFRYTAGDTPMLSYYAPWPVEVVYSFRTGERTVRPAEGRQAERGERRGPVLPPAPGSARGGFALVCARVDAHRQDPSPGLDHGLVRGIGPGPQRRVGGPSPLAVGSRPTATDSALASRSCRLRSPRVDGTPCGRSVERGAQVWRRQLVDLRPRSGVCLHGPAGGTFSEYPSKSPSADTTVVCPNFQPWGTGVARATA